MVLNRSNAWLSDDVMLALRAIGHIRQEGRANAAFLQQRLRIGFDRARMVQAELEKLGVLSPMDHHGVRTLIPAFGEYMKQPAALETWPPGYRSPLSVDFNVSRTALDLAGGVTAMNELFASRLGAHLRDRGECFNAWHTDMMAIAVGKADNNNGMMLMIAYQWVPTRFAGREATYHLEGVDAVRRIIAAPGCDQMEPDDPFWMLFASVRDLVLDWPEVTPLPK